jgi:hypothetical protein
MNKVGSGVQRGVGRPNSTHMQQGVCCRKMKKSILIWCPIFELALFQMRSLSSHIQQQTYLEQL